jgi:hypothetical protein
VRCSSSPADGHSQVNYPRDSHRLGASRPHDDPVDHLGLPAVWRQSAKRESLANSRGSIRGEPNPADGLASVANVEFEYRNWSRMPAVGPRCPRCERIANEPPTFGASLSPLVEIAGGGEQQRVSVLRTWSRRRATLRHAGRQHQPRTTASLRIGPRCITPLLAAGPLRGCFRRTDTHPGKSTVQVNSRRK